MFYEIFCELCRDRQLSPSAAALEIGINKGSVSYWKKKPEIVPTGEILNKVSAYFGVSIDYLLGKTQTKKQPTAASDDALLKLLEDPKNREIFEKMMKLNARDFEAIHNQISFLSSRQEPQADE